MKDAYYFSHDSNAQNDPKIVQMRSVYGAQGYGWYWMLIETLREQDEYRLDISTRYAFDAFAMQLQSDGNTIKQFITDCINEFHLFKSDGKYFWSESLNRRMVAMREKSLMAKKSAVARWDKQKKEPEKEGKNANAMRTQCDGNASKVKEKKVKESKDPPPVSPPSRDKPSKIKYSELVELTEAEHARLVAEFGEEMTKAAIEYLDLSIPNSKTKYTDHNRAIRKWVITAVKEKWRREGGPPGGQAGATLGQAGAQPKGKYNSKYM